MKTFYGGKFIVKSKLEKEGIFYPIKLEYYKSIETKENRPSDNYARFGISVVKTEYIPDNIKIVSREVKDISADERKIENCNVNIIHEDIVVRNPYSTRVINTGVRFTVRGASGENIFALNFHL